MLALERPAYIVMPGPISTNNLHRNIAGAGRVTTGNYRSWQKAAGECLAAQAPLPRFGLPVEVTFFVGEKGVGMMDGDNVAKAYLDALVKAKVIQDDNRKWVRSSRPVWVPGLAGCVIEIRPARPAPTPTEIMARVPLGLRELLR